MSIESKSIDIVNGIGRCKAGNESLISREAMRHEIADAFRVFRAFWFYPDREIVQRLAQGELPSSFVGRFTAIKNEIFTRLSGNDQYLRGRLYNDARLSLRVVRAIQFVHQAVARIELPSILGRRFVLIKERIGSPTLLHESAETTIISHIGPGPDWEEISSIYLGLNIFDVLRIGQRKGDESHFDTFTQLLTIEARAIETGYAHIEITDKGLCRQVDSLVDEILRIGSLMEREIGLIPEDARFKAFSEKARQKHLRLLNARMPGDELNFHYDSTVEAIESLEEHARQYKGSSDRESLLGVVKLLVAASGHDVHEVRDRANLALERIFSPKEYDAPLATSFVTLKAGDSHTFRFNLTTKTGKFFLRLYRNPCKEDLCAYDDLSFTQHPLVLDEESGQYSFTHRFDSYGQVDFVVFRQHADHHEWLHAPGLSGRINVVPDVRGEIILEIFTDIHGHTRVYWGRPEGHPGLVYNENGEVIRLGRFSDVAAHLEDLRERYRITAIYLLGVQKRGHNREDWAEGASSPSPFSPMSLVEVEPQLGGEAEFKALVARAHELGIKIIVDVVPHLNRYSKELPDEVAVQCYGDNGNLAYRAATDGRYGSWNDGRLLNYRCWEVWEWLIRSVEILIETYDIDGIRFDSAHAVPVMMKKNNDLKVYYHERSLEEMVTGRIVVNEREDDHLITTGFYDSASRDLIAVPLHHYMMARLERTLKRCNKDFFINLAECYWGHERFLTRSGIIPYNSALFKICESITHGQSDVSEIYHLYDRYFPTALPEGSVMLGILGNHDERRALNTFGQRGLRAAIATTIFLSDIVMDYEGNAEGESWKVYLDNIYVNWNQFESVSHRSLERYYQQWYTLHAECPGRGYVIWANNPVVAAAIKVSTDGTTFYVGAFNFSDSNQAASLQFDNPRLPLEDDAWYKVVDPLYSPITGHCSYFTGRELKVSRLNTIVSFTERVKLLRLDRVDDREGLRDEFFRDSFIRLCEMSDPQHFTANFAFLEFAENSSSYRKFSAFIRQRLLDGFWEERREQVQLGLKRVCFHLFLNDYLTAHRVSDYIMRMTESRNEPLRMIGSGLEFHNQPGPMVFMSAEMEPFSKSGGLANVVYELPRQLARLGEEVYAITPLYRQGPPKAQHMMQTAIDQHGITYSGRTVRFMVMNQEYEVGVFSGEVDGIRVFLLDNAELFDGLYWGITSQEKLRRRIGFARACTELICSFGLHPLFTFTNDAFTGPFNGIVRSDPLYLYNPNFRRTSFLHIMHNGGWQYFDSFHRWEEGFDLFNLFNLPAWRADEFVDPVHGDRLNCMAAGVRFADRVFTVSPSYATQVQYACDGLEHILKDVIGISNGIGHDFGARVRARFEASGFTRNLEPRLLDEISANSGLRKELERRYPELVDGYAAVSEITDVKRRSILQRLAHKLMLQIDRNLEVTLDKPLFVMIHRITEQKGWQLLLEASEGIFGKLGYQAVLGGAVASGDRRGEEIVEGLWKLKEFYPRAIDVQFGFQDIAIPFMAADVVGMPSQSEPGGLVQLEAFACSNFVVARATGGLRDTVYPVRVQKNSVSGNGFLFSDYTHWALYDAMERAADFLRTAGDDVIHAARQNAEASVFHWDRPALQYIANAYMIKEIIRPIDVIEG